MPQTAALRELGLDPPPRDGPAILVYDIETAPILGYTWTMWDANVLAVKDDWYMLSFAYQWYGKRSGVRFVGLNQLEGREAFDTDDTYVVERLHALFDAADVIVAHNNDKFDMKKANTRFLFHGFDPPSPYTTIDTLKETRKHFGHSSNKLNEVCRQHGIGEKVPHFGITTWLGCMAGDPKHWRIMQKYNKYDVRLLIEWFDLIRPWTSPARFNAGQWEEGQRRSCSKCGSDNIIKRGQYRTKVSVFQAYQCKDCGGYSRDRLQGTRPDMEWRLT